jgi:acetylglutamate kinase
MVEKLIEKANILMEALPYIRRFYQKTIVIKYGGHAMADEGLRRNFALDVVLLNYIGIYPVIVHGGGPQIGHYLEKLGKRSTFVDGMRVTDRETMDVVEMVLTGKVNKEIVALINLSGGQAVGISGKDGQLVVARKMRTPKNRRVGSHQSQDMGMVGEVKSINPTVISALDQNRFIPVIAPVGIGEKGETYNINADLVAGKIGAALRAEKLILLTDVEGVMGKAGKLVSSLTATTAGALIREGHITGGMIPKVKCCLNALREGVGKAHIVDGRITHALLLEIFTDVGIGTQITKGKA